MRLKATNELAVEVDIEHTRWSSFDTTVVTHSNLVVPSPIVSTNDWRDSWTYRVGFNYDVRPGTRLRAGYAYDQTPLNADRLSARLADANRNIITAGLSQNFMGWVADVGYSYTKFHNRNYNSTVPFGTYGADPNGTNFYNGTYRSHAHVLGLGATTSF